MYFIELYCFIQSFSKDKEEMYNYKNKLMFRWYMKSNLSIMNNNLNNNVFTNIIVIQNNVLRDI